MHYFVSMSDDQKFIRTKAPSESILAYASAVQTLRKPEFRSAMIGHFYSSITNGSIHVWYIGEIVAIFMLLFTMDNVSILVLENYRPFNTLNPKGYRPVSLTAFL